MTYIDSLLTQKLNISHLLDALDALSDGVLLLDEQGKIVFANKEFISLSGYDKVYLLERPYAKLLKRLVKQEDQNNKIKIYNKKGYTTPVEVASYPLQDNSGKHFSVIVYRERHTDLLIEITAAINSSLKLQEVLGQTTRTVVEYLELSSVAIFLKEQDKLNLVSCNAYENEEELGKVVIPVGQGAPGIVARDKLPVYVANLRTDPLIDEVSRSKHSDKSSIGYPLICKNELLGVIAFDAQTVREFTKQEVRLFESIANQVAIAVYNAKLFEELEFLSNTDSLTGLYNLRYLKKSLTHELNRCKRSKTNSYLSVLMIDIDFFKGYNDTFGHPAGDAVLREFAELLLASIRDYDIACRYGGEEFIVVLPDCCLENAREIAERIRQDVEKHSFYGREKQPGGKITISIGISCYPQVKLINELIKSADDALYKAKRLGRNRIEFSDM